MYFLIGTLHTFILSIPVNTKFAIDFASCKNCCKIVISYHTVFWHSVWKTGIKDGTMDVDEL